MYHKHTHIHTHMNQDLNKTIKKKKKNLHKIILCHDHTCSGHNENAVHDSGFCLRQRANPIPQHSIPKCHQERPVLLGVLTNLKSQAHRRGKLQSQTARPANTKDNQMVRGKHKNVSKKNQGDLAHQNPVLPPQQALDTLTHEKSKILI